MSTEEGITERRDYLFRVIDNLLQRWNEWSEENDRGLSQDHRFYLSCTETIEAFESGAMPESCRQLLDAIERHFAPAWNEYVSIEAVSTDPHIEPGMGLWNALDILSKLREDAKPKPPKSVETFKQLMSEKVPYHQICRIKGWMKDGAPETWKIYEEIEKPGTHENPNQLSTAARKAEERKAKKAQEAAERMERMQRRAALQKPAPESIEDLVKTGVDIDQIMRMKKCTREDVEKACTMAGLAIPEAHRDIRSERHPGEAALDETESRRLDAAAGIGRTEETDQYIEPQLTQEQQVLQVIDENPDMSDGEVASATGMTRQKVTAIRKRREEIDAVA